MGISGLLGLLKEAQESVHVSKHSGKRAAVDAYCWLQTVCILSILLLLLPKASCAMESRKLLMLLPLQQGGYAASRELCEDLPTTKYALPFPPLLTSFNFCCQW